MNLWQTGALRSTVDDLLKFLKIHIGNQNSGYLLSHQATHTISKDVSIGLDGYLKTILFGITDQRKASLVI